MVPSSLIRVLCVLASYTSFSFGLHAQAPPPPPPPQGVQSGQIAQPGQPQRPPQPPGKIAGRVLRADNGQPLLKATVTLMPDGRFTDSQVARVDRAGRFEFPEVPPGRYRVAADRNGYVRQTYGQRGGGPGVVVEVQSRQAIENLQFNLERGGVISGVVLDEDNEAVDGIEVRAQRVVFQPGGRQRAISVRTARTDDLGSYRLTGLAPGFYYVQAAGRGDGIGISTIPQGFAYSGAYFPGVAAREEAQRVQVSAGNETRRIDFMLRPGNVFNITGIIVDPNPAPALQSYAVGTMRDGGMASFGVSGEDKKFTVRNVEPGEHLLFAMSVGAGGEQRRGYRKVTVGDSDVSIVIEIGKTANISGELRMDGEGGADNSLSRHFVGLQTDGESFPFGGSPVMNNRFEMKAVAEGRYNFTVVDPGNTTYLKEARCGGEDYMVRKITLVADQSVDDCVLVLARDVASAMVTATRDDKPAEGAIVVLIPKNAEDRKIPRMYATAQTAKDGTATLRGIVPGEYYGYALPPTDNSIHYDAEFYSRNRDTAASISVQPNGQHALALKVITPK